MKAISHRIEKLAAQARERAAERAAANHPVRTQALRDELAARLERLAAHLPPAEPLPPEAVPAALAGLQAELRRRMEAGRG